MPKKQKQPTDEQLLMQVQIAAGAFLAAINEAKAAGLTLAFGHYHPNVENLKIIQVTRNIPVPKDGAAP